jgi:lipoprotein-anchoring transpeptidase ErfK/SrfK
VPSGAQAWEAVGDDLGVDSLRDTVRMPLAVLIGVTVAAGVGSGTAGAARVFVTTQTSPTASATATPAPTTPNAAASTTATSSASTASTATTTDDPTPTTAATTSDASADPSDEDGLIPAAPTKAVSYAARLVVPTVIRSKPSTRAKRITKLQPYGSWNGGPVVLAIAEVREISGVRWLRVRLPVRPNGKTGWLPQSSVDVSRLRYRIEISRRRHLLNLLRDGQRVASARVVIGAPSTPTPKGSFAVLEVVRQPKGSILGPWALHLTAHSNVLDNFGGGPGRVALHGRSGGLLNDPLGSSRSHGCIRMDNAFVKRLERVAVEGTPVTIR